MSMKPCLNSFTLKIIALTAMIIDHIGAFLFPQYLILRIIGRLAFPIYAFLVVEGFFHTSDVKRYMMRLAAFAVISEAPFDLVITGKILEAGSQNIFFTLFIGVALMYLYGQQYSAAGKMGCVILAVLAGDLFRTDYGSWGVLMIFCFYIFRERKWAKNLTVAGINVIAFGYIQAYAVIALPFFALYNGKRGPGVKYFFYAVYPVHLLLIFFVKIMI